MTSRALRRAGVPLAVAFVVLALVLGVIWLVDPPGSTSGGSVIGSPGSGGDGAPGSSGSAEPLPVSPSRGPDEPMSRFSAVTPSADNRSLQVQFWGGVDDCYRYRVRADESDGTVSLSLSEERTSDGPCIELAQQYDRTVHLDEALGIRDVVDATTGETLLAPSP